jgi:type I restriction-modification system DNA methylase subunit
MPQERLINPRLLKSHLQVTDIPAPHLEILQAWQDSIENRSIFKQTETALHSHFIQKILIKVLGYQGFSGDVWTLAQEQKIGAGSVDVALGEFSADSAKILAPFELKGAKTKDLDAIMPGRHKSPVQQAWEYAMDAPGAAWVLVSNYLEIRLYAVGYGRQAYETWDLSKLTDPMEYARLQWLVSEKQLLSGETRKILEQSEKLEKEITNQLYKDYKTLRENLLHSLTVDNPAISKLDLIRHTQTILDRILFIAFAEDRGLLPDKTLAHAYEQQNPYNPQPIWENFKGLFRAIDKGNAALNIPEYNGGLFESDAVLESLIVNDELCKAFKNLGEYDFASEISVTVLGHIFEQSISDIEGLQAEAKGERGGVSKRKKDGIFYTPAYITRYIVEQAVGGWLADRKREIGLDELPELTDIDYKSIKTIQRGKRKGTVEYNDNIKRHVEAWEAYKTVLSNIKVLDPACGSGAFLTEVFDYLYREGQIINNQLAELNAGQITLFKWDTHILANNLYGVDINHESVEITKLSLWLKTANRQEKLTYLEDNIKCGNSLIDDPDIAGDKAFKWDVEFAEIMQAGGFDVVVGNPPYGAKQDAKAQNYLNQKYIKYASETVVAFIKLSYDILLKEKSKFGFIIPKSFTFSSNYEPIRSYLIDNINKIIDCRKVWKEVLLEQVILVFTKTEIVNFYDSGKLKNKNIFISGKIAKDTYQKFGFYLNGISEKELSIALKLISSNKFLKDISTNTRGGMFQKYISDEGDISVLGGAEIKREGIFNIKGKINRNLISANEKNFIQANSVLAQNIVSHIENPIDHIKITACFPDNREYAIVDTINQITFNPEYNAKVFWLLLNSNLINWYCYRFIFAKAIRTMHFDNSVTSRIPIPLNFEQYYFIEKADFMLSVIAQLLTTSDKFISLLKSEFPIQKITKKIDNWYTLEFSEFIKELGKQKIALSLSQKSEWMEYFNEQKQKALALQAEIEKTDKEIDQMVYELYGLTEDEIKLVEENQ